MDVILKNIFVEQFITVMMITGLLIVLRGKNSIGPIQLRTFKQVLFIMALLMIVDSIELYAAKNPSRVVLRTLMSIGGYCIRPLPIIGMIILSTEDDDDSRKAGVIWIPEVINIATNMIALFSPLPFYFDESYKFHRGPLGYIVFIVSFIYLVILLVVTYRLFNRTRAKEGIIVLFSSLACVAAVGLTVFGINTQLLNPTICCSVALYYIFLNREYTSRDLNTRLLNRTSFYEDMIKYGDSITAIATIDMNGLKTINDNWGHHEGDKYLKKIGDTLTDDIDKRVLSYRTGGDEFVVLFLNLEEDQVREKTEKIREETKERGVSISIGYAYRKKDQSLEELHHLSDSKMYEDKRNYYLSSGIDRRKR